MYMSMNEVGLPYYTYRLSTEIQTKQTILILIGRT